MISDNEPPTFAPPAKREAHRITTLFAADHAEGVARTGGALTEFLGFGSARRYYEAAQPQLPLVLGRRDWPVEALELHRACSGVTAVRDWLFAPRLGGLVWALTVDIELGLIDLIGAQDQLFKGQLMLGGDEPSAVASALARAGGVVTELALRADAHQLVFAGSSAKELFDGARGEAIDADVVQRLVYRADLPYRATYSAIKYPGEPNRRHGALAAVGPYVSVIAGQQDYVENAFFVSAVQALASLRALRTIRDRAFEALDEVRTVTNDEQLRAVDRRRRLGALSAELGSLQLELSFGVEAYFDLGLMVPSLRMVDFHAALFEAMGLRDGCAVTGGMLSRLDSAITAERDSVQAILAARDDRRRTRYAVAVGALSVLAIPLGIIFGFFGASAKEIDPRRSFFDPYYLPLYLSIAAGLLIAAMALGVATIAERRKDLESSEIPSESSLTRVRASGP